MFLKKLIKIGAKNMIKASAIMGVLASMNPLLAAPFPTSTIDNHFNINGTFVKKDIPENSINKQQKAWLNYGDTTTTSKEEISKEGNEYLEEIRDRITEKEKSLTSNVYSQALVKDIQNNWAPGQEKTNQLKNDEIFNLLRGIGEGGQEPRGLDLAFANTEFLKILKKIFHFNEMNDRRFFFSKSSKKRYGFANYEDFLKKCSLEKNKESIQLFNMAKIQKEFAYLAVPELVAELLKIQALILQNETDNKSDMKNVDVINILVEKSIGLSRQLKSIKTADDIKISFKEIKKYYEENITTIQNLLNTQLDRLQVHSSWKEDLNLGKNILEKNLTKEEKNVAFLPAIIADVVTINYHLKQIKNHISQYKF